ncbi:MULTISPECIES: hypothetical protein [unclassified Leucobacter]|uniref:hypothetical protein n=1 Tax=unclassified Leucobacter TaxID=2621730 RepID=UPI00301779E5
MDGYEEVRDVDGELAGYISGTPGCWYAHPLAEINMKVLAPEFRSWDEAEAFLIGKRK